MIMQLDVCEVYDELSVVRGMWGEREGEVGEGETGLSGVGGGERST